MIRLHGVSLAMLLSSMLTTAIAAQPATVVTHRELNDLGAAIRQWHHLTDNVYLRKEHRQQLLSSAKQMVGLPFHFDVTVKRVTLAEVVIDVDTEDRARIALKHAHPPEFGDLGTIQYCSTPSTRYASATPPAVALRIGSEISLEVAKTLRRGDVLHLQGIVDTMHVHLDNYFHPRALAVISHFHLTGVEAGRRNRMPLGANTRP